MSNSTTSLSKPLWMMTAQEFLDLMASREVPEKATKRCQAIGITKLAEELGCSVSMLYFLKKKGVLNDSIISHIGKKVVFDVDRARDLANDYQALMRAQTKDGK